MIDFSRLNDKDYFDSILDDITTMTSIRDLTDAAKIISIREHDGSMDKEYANQLLALISNRLNELSGKGEISPSKDYFESRGLTQENGKRMQMTPKKNNKTAVSNHYGTVSIVFLVVNVALIAVMYTLLVIANMAD